jgi:hypothetical protein
MEGEAREIQFDALIERCRTRIQQYERLEDWLISIQQSGFNGQTIAGVRDRAREERLSAITRQVRDDLSTLQGGRNDVLKPVLDILAELNLQDESVYDSVLLACDTAQSGELEAALATVKYCQARAEQGLRTVPEVMALQRRREASAAALGSAVSGGGIGAMIGAIGGVLACIGVSVNEGINAGVSTFVVCSLIGCALGAFIGYRRGHKRASNS